MSFSQDTLPVNTLQKQRFVLFERQEEVAEDTFCWYAFSDAIVIHRSIWSNIPVWNQRQCHSCVNVLNTKNIAGYCLFMFMLCLFRSMSTLIY